MLLDALKKRSGNCCELCGSTTSLSIYQVPPSKVGGVDDSILACETCISQINNPETTDSNHWRCLNDSMWSEHLPVKVVAWRMLNRLNGEGWSLDLLKIALDPENAQYIEGKVEGQQIVILTQYVKKTT